MKAINIARVSTEEQKDAGNSLPAQIVRLENYCHNKNFEILKSFSFDESAYKDQRQEFDLILDFIIDQKDKVAVCCDKVDRLSRNIFDKRISTLYEKALKDEIELHFASDGQIINSKISAVEKFQFGMSLGLAKYISDAISDNVKRANEQKLRKGEWTGKAPYGYKNITREDGKKDILVDDYSAGIIKAAFQIYASGFHSLELTCKKLQVDYGIHWTRSYICKVFNNSFYYGNMVIKGKIYPHRYPPIISQELFDKVQEIKAGFNKKRFKYAGIPFMYRGMIRCATCGLAVTPERHKGLTYYHCTQYNGKHNAKWLREEKITTQIEHVFKQLQMPDEIAQKIAKTLDEVHQYKMDFHKKHFNALIKEQKGLNTMLDNLYLDKLRGKITEERYEAFYQKLQQKLNDVITRLGNLEEAETNYFITAKYTLALISRAHDLFKSSEVAEKQLLIKFVLSNIKIDGENIVWEVNKPFDILLKSAGCVLWRPQGDSNPCFRRERAMS